LRTRRYLSVVPNPLALIAMKVFVVVLVFLVAGTTKGSSRNLENK
jgi:hypothetical protein